MRQRKPRAQQQSDEKAGTETRQRPSPKEVAPIDFTAFGRRLSEIIVQAVRSGRKTPKSKR
jgi:hypothetical protein